MRFLPVFGESLRLWEEGADKRAPNRSYNSAGAPYWCGSGLLNENVDDGLGQGVKKQVTVDQLLLGQVVGNTVNQ